MKKHLFSALAVLSLLPAGCKKEATTDPSGLTFNALIEAPSANKLSRVQLADDGSGSFQPGDRIRLVASGGGSNIATDYAIGDKLYWEQLHLPSGTQSVTFSALYPALSVTDPAAFAFDVAAAADKDLLCAVPVTATVAATTACELVFKHMMHQLIVRFTSDGTYSEAELTALTCSLDGVLPTAVVNILQGKCLSATGTRTALRASGKSAVFQFAPQAVSGISLKISIAGKPYDYTFPETIDGRPFTAFESGKVVTCNLQIRKNQVAALSFSITGWESQGTIDGDIIL